MRALRVIRVPLRKPCKLRLYFVDYSAVALCKHLGIIYRDVAYSVIEIISRSKNIMLHSQLRFVRHIRRRKLACGLALPILIDLAERLLRFLRYVKRIGYSGLHRIELRLQPLKREFGEYLTSPRRFGGRSDYKLVIPYYNRKIFENMTKGFCASGYHRLAFCFFV